MEQTELLRDLVEELWERRSNNETILRLKAIYGDELHIERTSAPPTVWMRYYVTTAGDKLVKDLELLLIIAEEDRWIPSEFYRANTGRHVYIQVNPVTGERMLVDPVNQRACADYCDGWSCHLREQDWLVKGVSV